jgi:hypothetical protein
MICFVFVFKDNKRYAKRVFFLIESIKKRGCRNFANILVCVFKLRDYLSQYP